jgi:hypothetical protein
MSENLIIATLKANPRMNIYQVAQMLGMDNIQVSKAQHQYLSATLSRYRNSKLWDTPGYNSNGLPWLKIKDHREALKLIEAGEKDVVKRLLIKYRIPMEYKSVLVKAELNQPRH